MYCYAVEQPWLNVRIQLGFYHSISHDGYYKKSLRLQSNGRLVKGGGGDLLYRSAVPSALQGLTAVFGMGTGGTPVP